VKHERLYYHRSERNIAPAGECLGCPEVAFVAGLFNSNSPGCEVSTPPTQRENLSDPQARHRRPQNALECALGHLAAPCGILLKISPRDGRAENLTQKVPEVVYGFPGEAMLQLFQKELLNRGPA